jgi:tRNA1(Val) A37 N6-methylase TrmN6
MTVDLTENAFLGGALRLTQPRRGFRAGLDGVLLGASAGSLPKGGARNGTRNGASSEAGGRAILDAGTGTGIVALTAALVLPDARVTALEAVPEMAAIARANGRTNGLDERVEVVEGDLLGVGGPSPLRGRQFDHVLTNPPYHDPARERPSPDPLKARASSMAVPEGLEGAPLEAWLGACLKPLVPGGTLTVVHRTEALSAVLAALDGCGAARILPFWPRSGEPAKRILVRAIKGAKSPAVLLPGLVLHDPDGGYTPEADAILRGHAPLSFD